MDTQIQQLLKRIEALEARLSMSEDRNQTNDFPPNFDGSIDFKIWLGLFSNSAKRNMWSKRTCVEIFPFFMKNFALALYENLPNSVKSDWETLIRVFSEELTKSKEEEDLANAMAACAIDFFKRNANMYHEEREYPDDEDEEQSDFDGDEEGYPYPGYPEDEEEIFPPENEPYPEFYYQDDHEVPQFDPDDYEDGLYQPENYDGGYRRSHNFC